MFPPPLGGTAQRGPASQRGQPIRRASLIVVPPPSGSDSPQGTLLRCPAASLLPAQSQLGPSYRFLRGFPVPAWRDSPLGPAPLSATQCWAPPLPTWSGLACAPWSLGPAGPATPSARRVLLTGLGPPPVSSVAAVPPRSAGCPARLRRRGAPLGPVSGGGDRRPSLVGGTEPPGAPPAALPSRGASQCGQRGEWGSGTGMGADGGWGGGLKV